MTKRFTRRQFDTWFPTLARYCGLGILIYAGAVDHGRNPYLIPAGVSLVFLKNVINGGSQS